MATTRAIEDNAQHHAHLLQAISNLDYVPAAKVQQTKYLSDLEAQLKTTKASLDKLTVLTKKERKEHEELRDSVARKWAFKLSGQKDKFKERATKEESQYVEALEKEMKARANKEMIEQMVAEGKEVLEDLTKKEKEYNSSKFELAALYKSIFDGPTAEFPKDDELERNLAIAQSAYDQVLLQLNAESQAVDLLFKADKEMNKVEGSMQEALSASTWDMWGGGTMADMMERNALSQAGVYASHARILCIQAQQASPSVQVAGTFEIPQISMLGDVFFDNIFSDMAAHSKIEESARQLMHTHRLVQRELESARKRGKTIGNDLAEAASVLDDSRTELDIFRRNLFLQVSSEDRPPVYEHTPPGPSPQTTPETAPSMPVPQAWGNRNPYAALLMGEPQLTNS